MWRLLLLFAFLAASFGCGLGAWAEQPRRTLPSEQLELAREKSPVAVLAARSSLTSTRRAPLLERLPAVLAAHGQALTTAVRPVEAVAACSGAAPEPCLRIRRRLPRMSSDEPPWS